MVFDEKGTASSGLPVTFSVTTFSVCTLSGNVVQFIASGQCSVQFIQEGNSVFNAAPQISRSFGVSAGVQVISYTLAPSSGTVGGFANLGAVSSAGKETCQGSFCVFVCSCCESLFRSGCDIFDVDPFNVQCDGKCGDIFYCGDVHFQGEPERHQRLSCSKQ